MIFYPGYYWKSGTLSQKVRVEKQTSKEEMNERQLDLSEYLNYHDSLRKGYFSILYKDKEGFKQESHQLKNLSVVEKYLEIEGDVWISQGEFFKFNRQLVNLSRISLNFIDLDIYKVKGFNGMSISNMVKAIVLFISEMDIPEPSLILYSGQGFQLKWYYDEPLPAQALPRWSAVQRLLVEKLAPIGADPVARDASRVLRLNNTINTKTGNKCEIVHLSNNQFYEFDYLADEILPFTRDELKLRKFENSKKGERPKHFFLPNALAWNRLGDLRKLVQIRGSVEDGKRMINLFWQLNFMLLSKTITHENLYENALSLAQEIDPQWYEKEYIAKKKEQELITLFNKAKQFSLNDNTYTTKKDGGKSTLPLYTPKNQTLIDIFEITPEEERQLITIISTKEKYRRKNEVRYTLRRDEYLSSVAQNRAVATSLKEKGLTTQHIADKLSVDARTVQRMFVGSKISKAEKIAKIEFYQQRGYSGSQIATEMGVSRQYISKILKSVNQTTSRVLY